MNIETKFYRENEMDDKLSNAMFDVIYSGEKTRKINNKNLETYHKCILDIFDMALSESPKSFLALTYCDNSAVNMVLVSNYENESYCFKYVATNDNYRNRGMAYFAEKNCIAKIKEQGGKTVEAYIEDKNLGSKKLHKKSGFTKVPNKLEDNAKEIMHEYKLDLNNSLQNDEKLAI